MEFPKNFSRSKDVEKKVKRKNFYSRSEECKLDAYLDPNNSEVFENTQGASVTIQGIMRVNSTTAKDLFCMVRGEMFMKAFSEQMGSFKDGENDPSLAMEVLILRYLSYFKTYRISPCVQQYYMDFTCSKSPETEMGDLETQIYGEYKKLRKKKYIYSELMDKEPRIRYVMSEFIDGPSVEEHLPHFEEKDFQHILFQVFYTADQFHRAGVKHNDIHTKNVLVRPIAPQDLHFVTSQGIVVLEGCRYLVKIIDYDLSYFYEKAEWNLDGKTYKTDDDMCQDLGVCRVGDNPKFDQVTFLTYLILHLKKQKLDSFFIERFCSKVSSEPKDMLQDLVSKYKSGWPGRLCHNLDFIPNLPEGDEKNRGVCNNWVPSDELFRPFSYMIENNLFELKTLPFTPKMVGSLPMERAWVSLEINDKAYEELRELRSPKGKKTLTPSA